MRALFSTTTLFIISFMGLFANPSHDINTANKIVNQIYEKITSTVGDYRCELPRLVVLDREKNVAAYRKADNTLIIEKKTYDICQSLGKRAEDGLAFIIGHELAHFYQEHDWEAGFGTVFFASMEVFTQKKEEERSADLYGAFIAYQAGFETLDIIPSLLEKIYAGYHLNPSQMPNYPSLEDRKKVIESVRPKAEELIELFRAANYLTAIGQYQWASNCYDYILHLIKSQELYNNRGLATLANVLSAEPSFSFPIAMDVNLSIRRDAGIDRENLLSNAIYDFQKAKFYNRKYFPAQINLISALLLKQQRTEAAAQIEIAASLAKNNEQKAQLAILEGILSTMQREKEAAKVHFQRAKRLSSQQDIVQIADTNLKRLTGKFEPITNQKAQFSIPDQIDGVEISTPSWQNFNWKVTLNDDPFDAHNVSFAQLQHSKLIRLDSFDDEFALHICADKTQKTTKGIQVGQSSQQIRAAYSGKDLKVIQLTKGYFMIYPSLGLVFKIGANEQLQEWGIFAVYR